MTPKQRQRAWFIGLLIAGVAGFAIIVLSTLNNHLLFFITPTDIMGDIMNTKKQFIKQGKEIRLGGLVEIGSIRYVNDGKTIEFVVTDYTHQIPVSYHGIAPDLFREGQGVITEGTIDGQGRFTARRILAKHDENYMPKDVAQALKKSKS